MFRQNNVGDRDPLKETLSNLLLLNFGTKIKTVKKTRLDKFDNSFRTIKREGPCVNCTGLSLT